MFMSMVKVVCVCVRAHVNGKGSVCVNGVVCVSVNLCVCEGGVCLCSLNETDTTLSCS